MSHFITYVALRHPALLSAERLVARYRELYSEEAYRIEAPAVSPPPGKPIVLALDGMAVTVFFVDQPLPENAYEEALRLDRVWPNARAVMAESTAHVIVTLLADPEGHLPSLNGAAAVTLVAGVLADLLPAVALVSTEGRVIMPPETYAQRAAALAKHEIPVDFWTSMLFLDETPNAPGPQRITALSFGLLPFIGRELEFNPVALPLYEVAQRLVGLFQYLILNGPVIKDGDALGMTAGEQIRARYRNEGRRPGIPVIELTLEGPTSASPAAEGANAKSTRPSGVFGKRGR